MELNDLAAANAIQLEVKKDGLTQRQSGDWQLRFTVAHTDMDNRLAQAAMGTRFACVLVEINDVEEPVDHRAKDRDAWRDLGPIKQAGIRCTEPMFWAFLREEYAPDIYSEATAAQFVRDFCHVESRTDLNKPGNSEARTLWHTLDFGYQAWRVKEHA